ncbi:PH domain-containing protein [Streptomyces sp. NPDC046324]|uniref:PH domain-containing protein n=1 Tax=Streptomyces sp. NPDC046324 TaxID=3154915 RepID=UPI0033E3AC54
MSEAVDMLAGGNYSNGAGLLALTNLRLIFFKHGFMSQKLEDFPLGNISSVQWSAGLLMGTLSVFASGNKADIKQVAKPHGEALSSRLRMLIATAKAPEASPAPVPAQAGAPDVASRLATLDQLRAAGAITDEEYRDRRAAILASI